MKVSDYGKGKTESTLLNGKDLPKSQHSVEVVVTGVREAPENWNALMILDIEPVMEGKTAFAVNKTNRNAIAALIGEDGDADELIDKSLILERTLTRNPSTGNKAYTLVITGFGNKKPKERKPTPTGPASRRGGKAQYMVKTDKLEVEATEHSKPLDDDIPF